MPLGHIGDIASLILFPNRKTEKPYTILQWFDMSIMRVIMAVHYTASVDHCCRKTATSNVYVNIQPMLVENRTLRVLGSLQHIEAATAGISQLSISDALSEVLNTMAKVIRFNTLTSHGMRPNKSFSQ